MFFTRLSCFILLHFIACNSFSQQLSDSLNKNKLSPKYFSSVNNKLSSANKKLDRTSKKYLRQLQKQEGRLQKKLAGFDSATASAFEGSNEKYNDLINGLDKPIENTEAKISCGYNAYLDTLQTSLVFLKNINSLSERAHLPLSKLEQLKDKFSQSEKIKAYIAGRKEEIKTVLSGYTKLPQGIAKEFKKINKTAYYYSEQVQEYREVLKDQKKIEKKAIAKLVKVPAFQKFMQKNSQLAALFRMPDSYPDEAGRAGPFAGLQTRASVQALIQQQIPSGSNARQIVQHNIAQAQSELNKIKDKIEKSFSASNGLGDGVNQVSPTGGDLEGAFKPNTQKTKSFLKRLEYGLNVQAQKNIRYFPVTSDLGLSVSYKLNDKSTIGLGAAYKLGLGTGFNHIAISHLGVGLRSFIDYKIKGSFWLSGGYEQNYKSAFTSIEQLKNYSAWQSNGLIGLSKKYTIGKKKGNMQLLYDFLAHSHRPVSHTILYRVGCNF